jgi:hypothetical protein
VGSAVAGFKPGGRVTGIGFKKSLAEYATIDLASKERVTRIIKVPDGIPIEYCMSDPIKHRV